MARINYSFQMSETPQEAQAMFVRDIAPELAQARDFQIAHARPGELTFSDGAGPMALGLVGDAEAAMDGGREPGIRPVEQVTLEPTAPGGELDAYVGSDDLEGVFARHVRVEFTPAQDGTEVHNLHGHVERDLKHALEKLGTAQHWPATAGLPHD